jgi:YHS domain-containing protein
MSKKTLYKFFSFFSLVLFGCFFMNSFVLAGSATLYWDPNTEPDLAGYKIYYGTSPRTGSDPKVCGLCGYSNRVDVGKVTTYTLNNLTNGQTYYFSVTAYDTSNNESAFSNQGSKYITATKTADLNKDGYVNMQDASILMSYWGRTDRPAADLNQDGYVNMQDASIMMSQWG